MHARFFSQLACATNRAVKPNKATIRTQHKDWTIFLHISTNRFDLITTHAIKGANDKLKKCVCVDSSLYIQVLSGQIIQRKLHNNVVQMLLKKRREYISQTGRCMISEEDCASKGVMAWWLDEPGQARWPRSEHLVTHRNQIDGWCVWLRTWRKINRRIFEHPSPSNSSKETTSTPHGPFSNPGLLIRVSERSD